MLAKFFSKNEKLYIFEKPLTMPFQLCKKFADCLQKNCNFFLQTCAIRFLISTAFQKAKFYQNLTSGSGSKQRFSLLQEKTVVQAVCLRTQVVSIKAWF